MSMVAPVNRVDDERVLHIRARQRVHVCVHESCVEKYYTSNPTQAGS